MASVQVSVEFDLEEDRIGEVLDALSEVIQDVTGFHPLLGLQVDGEHRDPEDPLTDIFS